MSNLQIRARTNKRVRSGDRPGRSLFWPMPATHLSFLNNVFLRKNQVILLISYVERELETFISAFKVGETTVEFSIFIKPVNFQHHEAEGASVAPESPS